MEQRTKRVEIHGALTCPYAQRYAGQKTQAQVDQDQDVAGRRHCVYGVFPGRTQVGEQDKFTSNLTFKRDQNYASLVDYEQHDADDRGHDLGRSDELDPATEVDAAAALVHGHVAGLSLAKFTTFVSPSRHLGKTLTNGQGFRSGERKKIDTRPLRVSQHVLATDSEIVSGGKAKPWRHAPTTYVSGSIKKIKTLARRKQYTECEKFRKETNGPNS